MKATSQIRWNYDCHKIPYGQAWWVTCNSSRLHHFHTVSAKKKTITSPFRKLNQITGSIPSVQLWSLGCVMKYISLIRLDYRILWQSESHLIVMWTSDSIPHLNFRLKTGCSRSKEAFFRSKQVEMLRM